MHVTWSTCFHKLRTDRKRNLAQRTSYNIYTVVSALFRDAKLADLIEQTPCLVDEPRATKGFQPQTERDVMTHLYADNYDKFHRSLADAKQRQDSGAAPAPGDALFAGLPNGHNPIVSTGATPLHAGMYAFGAKPYEGKEQETLDPRYDPDGRPFRPYVGKLYASLHNPDEYDPATGAVEVAQLQNARRTNISQMIVPELETQFDAAIAPGKVVYQAKAKFPDLSGEYKPVYVRKYGLTAPLFTAFQAAMVGTAIHTTERSWVVAQLADYLIRYQEMAAIEYMTARAAAAGKELAYHRGPHDFGATPTPIVRGDRKQEPRAKAPGGTKDKTADRKRKRVTAKIEKGQPKGQPKKTTHEKEAAAKAAKAKAKKASKAKTAAAGTAAADKDRD